MPAPSPVRLFPYTPAWTEASTREIERLAPAFGENFVAVHHIGSTAIPGISAKPILDLMPVVRDLAALDDCRPALEKLGYVWWGEYGISERRYCTLSDPDTGERKVQMHCYCEGSLHVERHLAFRDYLRAHPDIALHYEAMKKACRDRHPLDSHAYTSCKDPWIRRVEMDAIAFYRRSRIPGGE